METYTKQFHDRHLYLNIDENETEGFDHNVFEALIAEYGKPLQSIVSSASVHVIGLLTQAGFIRKRTCYPMSVSRADLSAPLSDRPCALAEARRGTPGFDACAERMFAYYRETHAAVSPLTASEAMFAAELPDTVLYTEMNGTIAGAFVEENEIAYVFSDPGADFGRFADALLSVMFDRFLRIEFEADDTDPAATLLRNRFSVEPSEHFDTYIKMP